jgi:xyloglucan-specific exo-beta-1,4-glucanase
VLVGCGGGGGGSSTPSPSSKSSNGVSSASSLSSAPISSASSSSMSSASSSLISSISSSVGSSSVSLSSSSASSLPNTGETKWTNVKFGGGGYVTGLIFHPTTPDILYARTDIGGAYRWDPATSSWIPITDGLGFGAAESRFHGIESIALDPNNDQLVYMATGMYTFEPNGRLYISSDRGDHWTHVNLPFVLGGNNNGRAIGERLAVDPNKPSILFFGSRQAGLWKSTDSGLSWAKVTSLSPVTMSAAQVSAAGGAGMGVGVVVYDTGTKGSGTATQTIYAAIEPDYVSAAGLTSSIYRSTDGGASWAAVSTPVTGAHIPHMVRAADGNFYVVFTKGSGPGASGPGSLYKFDGTNWSLLKTGSMGFGGLSVYGSGASTRIALGVVSWGDYAGQQIVQLSDNGGLTWTEIEAQTGKIAPGWVDDLEINPFNRDNIMHVHGGGVIETQNASAVKPNWNDKVDGIEETALQTLVTPPPGAPYTVINSSGDVGTWIHTDLTSPPTLGPPLGWSNGFSADMAWSDPLYIAGLGLINNSGTATGYWSGDGGLTWAFFKTVPASAQANIHGQGCTIVTSRNNLVTAPANSIASYTTDNGATWTDTNLPALPPVGTGWNRGYRLAADRQNSNKVYAFDSGGASWNNTTGKVYVSTDAGHSFTLSPGSVSAGMAPDAYWETSIAVNANVEGDLWVADGNTVYHSIDSGATWTKFTNFATANGVRGASLIALGKAAPDSNYSAAVYVVGVIDGQWGIYRSDDEGATWTRFNDDAHQYGGIGVLAADWNSYGRIYFSGTGRGMFYTN